MGNVFSRCAQDVRNAWKRCAKKHTEEETMLSTCDSEHLDKCHEQLLEHSGVDRASRTGSPASTHRLDDNLTSANCRLLLDPSSRILKDQDYLNKMASTDHHNFGPNQRHPSRLIDRGSQTNYDSCDDQFFPDKPILSKAYIVKTYSLQNATPSPSPDVQSKFPPSCHSPHKSQNHTFLAVEEATSGTASNTSPLESLERRQEDVLKRLEQLQSSVSKLSQKYNVQVTDKQSVVTETIVAATASVASSSPATTIASSHGQALQTPLPISGQSTQDLVISADPSSVPLSLIVLSRSLSERYRVFMSTFVHSSVSDSVSNKLRDLLTSNSGIKRGDCDLVITLIWKKVSSGVQLVIDPTKQTTIEGEANVARYLARLLNPSYDVADIITATQTDEILDLVQLQLLEGKSKEKAAAVRTLNSQLGKTNWLTGSQPSVADIVCWSVVHQTNQAQSPPANVKKWLNLCAQHKLFQPALELIS